MTHTELSAEVGWVVAEWFPIELGDRGCASSAEGRGYICTRPIGHQGPHVAHGGEREALAVWCDLPGRGRRTTGPVPIFDDLPAALSMLRQLFEVLDGREWGADSLDAIGAIFSESGIGLRDFGEGGA